MTAGYDRDGVPLRREGDTYSSIETLSEEPSGPVSDAVMVERLVPSRSGLPLTEAIGRLGARLDQVEGELRYHRITIGLLIGVVLGLVALDLGVASAAIVAALR